MTSKEQLIKKYKLIFFLEYMAIGVILLTVGFLKIFDIIPYNESRLLLYNIITLVGVAYLLFDLVFSLSITKRRVRFSLIDKIFPLIAAIYLLVFDILVLAKINTDMMFIKYSIGAVLIYAGTVSLILGVYHHFKPSRQLLDAIEEEYQEKLLEEQEEKKDSTAE